MTLLWHLTPQEHVFSGESLATMLTSGRRSSWLYGTSWSWYGQLEVGLLQPLWWEVFSIFAHNCQQARHWVRVNYNIMLHRIYMTIIVKCQSDGCSLNNKDGLSFGQLVARHLTILAWTCQYRLHRVVLRAWQYSLDLTWAFSLAITASPSPPMRLCLFGSYPCVPSGNLCVVKRQRVGSGVGSYLLVAGINSCRASCARLPEQARVFR